MFDTIILLTGSVEQAALATVLRKHNPQLTIKPAETAADLAAIEPDLRWRTRLIAFATPVIVPASILNLLGYGAYNFHPGSPQYPGWAPAHFALYDGATEFGATVHVMNERVDSGQIVDVSLFPVPSGISVPDLETMSYRHLVQLFWKLANTLATQPEPLSGCSIHWSNKRNSRSAYRSLCDIPLDIGREDLYRRIHAFGSSDFGISPTIRLHGVEFRAVLATASPALASKHAIDAEQAEPIER